MNAAVNTDRVTGTDIVLTFRNESVQTKLNMGFTHVKETC